MELSLAVTLLIVLVFAVMGGLYATEEFFPLLALICIPAASISAGMLCAGLFGTLPGLVLGVLMLVGGGVHFVTYDDGSDWYC